MDSRCRFLHHLHMFDEAVTQKDRTSAVMVNRVGGTRLGSSKVHFPGRLSADRTEKEEGSV